MAGTEINKEVDYRFKFTPGSLSYSQGKFEGLKLYFL